jgi:hypothetical protein
VWKESGLRGAPTESGLNRGRSRVAYGCATRRGGYGSCRSFLVVRRAEPGRADLDAEGLHQKARSAVASRRGAALPARRGLDVGLDVRRALHDRWHAERGVGEPQEFRRKDGPPPAGTSAARRARTTPMRRGPPPDARPCRKSHSAEAAWSTETRVDGEPAGVDSRGHENDRRPHGRA